MTVVGLKTAQELRGESCIELDIAPEHKKMITVSRSFGRRIFDKSSVKEALANFAERATEKLRGEKQLAGEVYISLYRELSASGKANYKDTALFSIAYPTDSTLEIMSYVSKAFEEIYIEGMGYKKSS